MASDGKKDGKKEAAKPAPAAPVAAKEEPALSFAAYQARPFPRVIGTVNNDVTVTFGEPDKDKVTVRSSADSNPKGCSRSLATAQPIVDAYNKALKEGKVDFSKFSQSSGTNPERDANGNITWAVGNAPVKLSVISASFIQSPSMCGANFKLPIGAVGLLP